MKTPVLTVIFFVAILCFNSSAEVLNGQVHTSDGQTISYTHYENGSDKIVIIVHGFFNSKDSVLIKKLIERLSYDYDVFAFDLRGHGKSSGLFTWTSREGNDLEAVLEFLEGKYSQEAIVGFSYGAGISINVLAKNDHGVDSLVCVSAPSDPDKIDYKWWKLDLENDISYSLLKKDGRKGKGVRPGPFWLKKEDPIDNIEKIDIPTLFIHGNKDWVVGEWHSKALYDKTKAEKDILIIEGGFHAEYLMRHNEDIFVKAVQDWLKDTLWSK